MNTNDDGKKLPSTSNDSPWIWARRSKESQHGPKNPVATIRGMMIERDEAVVYKETANGISIERFPLSEESIDAIAKKYEITDGKWLIFRPRSEIDMLWKSIAKETNQGRLGTSAKVSTKYQMKQQHVICVYTADYFDSDEVTRVRERLRELGVEEQLYYKPDIYTHLGIYSGTCSIRPWKYKD